MAQREGAKWEGKAIVELKGPKPDQVWPFLEDFCNLHVWFPGLATCYQVDGVLGRPGLTRYCASPPPPGDHGGEERVMWAMERLIEIDPVGRWLSYEVLDNNMRLRNYVATARAVPVSDGSQIEWSFVCDPIDGLRSEDLTAYLDSCICFMAAKILEHDVLPIRK